MHGPICEAPGQESWWGVINQAVSASADGTSGKDNGSVVCLDGVGVTGMCILSQFSEMYMYAQFSEMYMYRCFILRKREARISASGSPSPRSPPALDSSFCSPSMCPSPKERPLWHPHGPSYRQSRVPFIRTNPSPESESAGMPARVSAGWPRSQSVNSE